MQDTAEIIRKLKLRLAEMPVYQYAFPNPQKLLYFDELRLYCVRRCRNYKACWSCPPAIGSLDVCMDRCRSYEACLMFSSIQEKRRRPVRHARKAGPVQTAHEKMTTELESWLENQEMQVYTLTGDRCRICRHCTWPKERCRYPELMHPCIESHGISMVSLAEEFGMDYYLDERFKPEFSLLFFRPLSKTILQ